MHKFNLFSVYNDNYSLYNFKSLLEGLKRGERKEGE